METENRKELFEYLDTIERFRLESKKSKTTPMEQAEMLVAKGGNAETIKSFVEIDRIITNSKSRIALLVWACVIITLHLSSITFIVLKNGTIIDFPFFEPFLLNVHDNVMIALLGSTTANIIGLGYIVLKGIFYVDDIHGSSLTPSGTSNRPLSTSTHPQP